MKTELVIADAAVALRLTAETATERQMLQALSLEKNEYASVSIHRGNMSGSVPPVGMSVWWKREPVSEDRESPE